MCGSYGRDVGREFKWLFPRIGSLTIMLNLVAKSNWKFGEDLESSVALILLSVWSLGCWGENSLGIYDLSLYIFLLSVGWFCFIVLLRNIYIVITIWCRGTGNSGVGFCWVQYLVFYSLITFGSYQALNTTVCLQLADNGFLTLTCWDNPRSSPRCSEVV